LVSEPKISWTVTRRICSPLFGNSWEFTTCNFSDQRPRKISSTGPTLKSRVKVATQSQDSEMLVYHPADTLSNSVPHLMLILSTGNTSSPEKMTRKKRATQNTPSVLLESSAQLSSWSGTMSWK
jgi:hypothetical protein